MARISAEEAGGAKVLAFLDAIAWSEIGPALLEASDDGYNILVGSRPTHVKLFAGYADHPNELVTVNSAGLQSTAAGRYQFLHRTWVELKAKLNLTDFGPENQDRAAIELIRECKALMRVMAGDVRNAVYMCANIWASLPGSGYGQHVNTVDAFADSYYGALGKYA